VSRRLARAHDDRVPFAVIVGDREIAERTMSVRAGERQWSGPVEVILADLQRGCAMPAQPDA
jgi:threonyl-tRNA synthetase